MAASENAEIEEILAPLNNVQKKAVRHRDGPLVVFAGAGSGKTRVITARIAYLVATGIEPEKILAVTFTNKAALEMRERVSVYQELAGSAHISTFHAACAKWLREFGVHLGYQPGFSIYDDREATKALRSIMTELDIEPEKERVSRYKKYIERAKTQGDLPKEMAHKRHSLFMAAEVYRRYQEYLSQCNAMDFADLLLNCLILLRRNKEVRKHLQDRYSFVMVDEYQDTNPTQFELVSILVSEHHNLFVVGDDDQSIYSWRGADPSNILKFKDTYPEAGMSCLGQNYRCSGKIIEAATNLISNNRVRAKKELWTANDDGDPITFEETANAHEEAFAVSEQIQEEDFPHEEVAVFFRTNAQSRLLENQLQSEGIPYRVQGALRFYERAEIKDIVAYFRIITNPDDNMALQRVLNTPPRGIGKKVVDQLTLMVRESGDSWFRCVRRLSEADGASGKKLKVFLELYETLVEAKSRANSLTEVLEAVLGHTNYLAFVDKRHKGDAAQEKKANIMELKNALYEHEQQQSFATITSWLRHVATNETEEEQGSGVSLMSLHAAKGLEFDRVFIVGVEDNLLPHMLSMRESAMLEEERRLLYVGITRARKKISLLSAKSRMCGDKEYNNNPSRFLKEIPTLGKRATTPAFSVGCMVEHPTFGRGELLHQDDVPPHKAIVDFMSFGRRKVPADHLSRCSV